MNVPIISGCFSIFRTGILEEIGLYDDKFFMYFEDFDLSRRIHRKYKTIYFPNVKIVHSHERGAAKNFRLFLIFIKSGIRYFSKYGWIFDSERTNFNKQILKEIGL
jgi:GT2 family glycosyltransferase